MAKKVKTTKLDIIKCASEHFFEQGYSATSPRMICDELEISTGNLTYYFPTKEHLLAVFAEMLCDFQWKMMEIEAKEGLSSVMAVCLEFATLAAMSDQDTIANDFLLSSYSSHLCLEIIRKNDSEKAKRVFGTFNPEWTDEKYAEAEILVSGVEYATLSATSAEVPLESRIIGGINNILTIYNLPEELRKQKIEKTLALDYIKISKRVLREFKKFIQQTTEKAFDELYESKKAKSNQ